jgi:hypothetical protein
MKIYENIKPVVNKQKMRDILNRLSPTQLTFVLEEIGIKIKKTSTVKFLLFPFLLNNNSCVREGAVLGLANHIENDKKIEKKLKQILSKENSIGVKQTIEDVLFYIKAKACNQPTNKLNYKK